MEKPFPTLNTERLTLRQPKLTDDREMHVQRSDERIIRFLGRPACESPEEARQFIAKILGIIENGDGYFWVITLKNEDKLIGTICYWNMEKEQHLAEIGYALHPDFHGKGIMQEALAEVIRFGFEQLQLRTITAFSAAENAPSCKLLERTGFQVDMSLPEYDSNSKDQAGMVSYILKTHN